MQTLLGRWYAKQAVCCREELHDNHSSARVPHHQHCFIHILGIKPDEKLYQVQVMQTHLWLVDAQMNIKRRKGGREGGGGGNSQSIVREAYADQALPVIILNFRSHVCIDT